MKYVIRKVNMYTQWERGIEQEKVFIPESSS